MSEHDPATVPLAAPTTGFVPADADTPAIPLRPSGHLDAHTRRTLAQTERAIADKYHKIGQSQRWPYVVGTIAGFALWVSFFPLTIMGIVPLWVAFIVSTIIASGGWITGHEAMHSSLGRKGTSQRFWNELTGHLAMIPLLFPFPMARISHLQHHKFTNDPVRDPDYPDAAPSLPAALWKVWLNRQPGKDNQVHHFRHVMVEVIGTPESKKALRDLLLFQLGGTLFFIAMATAGYAIEVALIWWLPRWVALMHIHVFFGWEPHFPHKSSKRYEQARLYKSKLGNLVAMGVEGHLVHHLYPHIPIHLTMAATREMLPALEARGVDSSGLRRR
jgi:beta-carotene hydroxylase